MGKDKFFRFHLYWFKRVVVKMCNDNKRHVNMVWGGRPSRPQPDTKKIQMLRVRKIIFPR